MKKKALFSLLFLSISTLLMLQSACGGVTPAPTQPVSIIPSALNGIGQVFQQAVQGRIVYNTPSTMKLDQTLEIQLLLSPTISAEELKKQIVELGQVVEAQIEVTPLMKAELKSADSQSFEVLALHDSPEQVILADGPTQWHWSITAKKSGDRILTLVLYRQVEYNGNLYWTLVETYRNNIHITVTPIQWLQNFDWKWLAGILLTAILIPAMWRLVDRNQKKKSARKSRVN